MVLVGVAERLLRDAEQTLHGLLDQVTDDVDIAFIAFVNREPSWRSRLEQAAQRARGHRGAERSYRDVAVLGFAAATFGSNEAVLSDQAQWLAGTKTHVAGAPIGIVEDRVALLGAALAVRGDPSAGLVEWLKPLVAASPHDSALDTELVRAAASTLGLPVVGAAVLSEAALVFARLGLVPLAEVDSASIVDSILRGALATEPRGAVLQLAAIAEIREHLPSVNFARASIADVVTVLQRVSAGLDQWTWEDQPRVRNGTARQWHVDHEYHVQNLLWAILRPAFPDLRREEYTDPLGPLHPRLDLGVPSLRLIIEVKFWRDSASAAQMVEQIASDSSVYFNSQARRYDSLVPLVWDNARRTERHDDLLRGLRSLPHVFDAVVISRPGKMSP